MSHCLDCNSSVFEQLDSLYTGAPSTDELKSIAGNNATLADASAPAAVAAAAVAATTAVAAAAASPPRSPLSRPLSRCSLPSQTRTSPEIPTLIARAPRRRKCGNAAERSPVSRSWRVTRGGSGRVYRDCVYRRAGNPKASVARIKVAGRFPACETVSLLPEGRTGTHEGRRAYDKKSFTAADAEVEDDEEEVAETEVEERAAAATGGGRGRAEGEGGEGGGRIVAAR